VDLTGYEDEIRRAAAPGSVNLHLVNITTCQRGRKVITDTITTRARGCVVGVGPSCAVTIRSWDMIIAGEPSRPSAGSLPRRTKPKRRTAMEIIPATRRRWAHQDGAADLRLTACARGPGEEYSFSAERKGDPFTRRWRGTYIRMIHNNRETETPER
jgi:hypothetical protein